MADLPIGSDDGAQPVVINDPNTPTSVMAVNVDGSTNHSLGSTGGKTVVMETGSLTTTAVTADQAVVTYTVTSGKTFFVEYLCLSGAQTTPAGGNAVVLGNISLEFPSGTKRITTRFIGGGTVETSRVFAFGEPIPVASGTVIRVVVTPAAASSFYWNGNFGGYER